MLGRVRNRALNVLSQKVLLRESQNAANYLLDRLNSRPLPMFILDSGLLADRYISPHRSRIRLSAQRSAFQCPLRRCGPSGAVGGFRLPPWWSRTRRRSTRRPRHPGHHRQRRSGSAAGADDRGAWRRGRHRRGHHRRPRRVHTQDSRCRLNTYVADYIPHDLLLPKVDVMVTNGGYGAVQRALSIGRAAGGRGQHRRQARGGRARGVDRRGHQPAHRRADRRRGARRSARRAQRRPLPGRRSKLEAAFARRDGVAEIAALVDEVIGEHSKAAHR